MRTIAAVILNYENFELTKQCVDNIIQKSPGVKCVIVDNDSRNDSYNYLNNIYADIEQVSVIKSPRNKGYAAGNNIGIKFIIEKFPEIEYVVIMNPDTLYENPLLPLKLKQIMEKNEELAIIAPVMIANGVINYNATCWNIPTYMELIRKQSIFYKCRRENKFKIELDNISYCDVVHGSFFMIRISTLKEIDLLDENTFLYNEENILGIQIKNINKKEAVLLDEFFLHNHIYNDKRQSLKNKLKTQKIVSDSRIYLAETYYNKWNIVKILKSIYLLNILIICCKHILGNIRIYFKLAIMKGKRYEDISK